MYFCLLLPRFCSVWLLFRNQKVSFVQRTKETFLSDAFLAEREAHCVRDAASPVMHAFGACVERIASPITAQRHHLSLICKRYIIEKHTENTENTVYQPQSTK